MDFSSVRTVYQSLLLFILLSQFLSVRHLGNTPPPGYLSVSAGSPKNVKVLRFAPTAARRLRRP
jgi:hypothetical protein